MIVKADDGSIRGVAWNHETKRTGKKLDVDVEIEVTPDAADAAEYSLITKTVDEDVCNPLKVWHDLGEPSSLSAGQKATILEASRPQITSSRIKSTDGRLEFNLKLNEFGVTYFECRKIEGMGDRGYTYERIMK